MLYRAARSDQNLEVTGGMLSKPSLGDGTDCSQQWAVDPPRYCDHHPNTGSISTTPAASSLPHTTPGTDFCHHRFIWLVLELGINVIVANVLTSFTQDTVGASAVPIHCCVPFHGAFIPWFFHPSHWSCQFLLISPSEHLCISLFGIYIDTFLRIYPGVEFLGHS